MPGKVLVLGALDTKAADFRFVCDILRRGGLDLLVIDVGVLGTPGMTADVDRAAVARAGGREIADFRSGEHKDAAMQAMADGAARLVAEIAAREPVAGIFGMGGSGGTAIATAAMRELPIGVPKVMVSTVGGGDVAAFCGGKDVIFFPSIVDVAGLNRVSARIYANAANAMVGMATAPPIEIAQTRPLLAASMFGSTTPCVTAVQEAMEAAGYEVLVFHATGTGGRSMEALANQGLLAGVMDITTTELADNLCGGVMDAGPERGLAAPRAGLPTLLVPGCVDMANFWGIDTVPPVHRDRHLYRWNPNVTLLRTDAAENREIGRRIAAAANAATGPVAVLLPLKGVSVLDAEGGEFHDPDADAACFDAIRETLKPGVPLYEFDLHVNDPRFAAEIAARMLALLGQS
ncbi:conserved hypothetical protein [uncultured Alphaproteobacteria bacterium]|uniref:Uncharacterized protein n=1 Tax=uncultured Alphaproteobacteria bacterium TaxID=91750 RepID=A0A212KM47_9PROT|nr:conserved hypothetical protein [uncultured Alphaproteobacteria bacterium]